MNSKREALSQGLEEKLVDHLDRIRFEDLPPGAVEISKLLVIDSLGTTVAGSHAPGCKQVVDLAKAWGGAPASSVMVYGGKVAPPFAALANSTMMHALDYDDTLDASALHTFVTVLPAALATAEEVGSVNGKELITALVLGVDMICRMSMGIRRPLSWIRTATCGSFGAAATCAKLLALDREAVWNALGIVYSQTSGNAQGLIEGKLVKRMQPAFASQAGLVSAFLARSGITGSRDFLEGTYGFYNLYERGDYDPDAVVSRLGEHFSIQDLSIKPYPSCRMTHSSIDAALELRERAGDALQEVSGVNVVVSRMVADMVGKPFVVGTNPQVDAQFSIPYTAACALLRGRVLLQDFEEEAIRDERILELAEKVKVAVGPELSEKDILPSEITVELKGGESYRSVISSPLGNPSKPMDLERCKDKFKNCLAYRGLDPKAERPRALLSRLEDLEHMRDVSEILPLMLF